MIKPLTSLRFFFAFFVFLSHISFIKSDAAYIDIFDNVFDEGFLGVSFFFILSGFILAYNYNDKILERKVSKSKFYIARILSTKQLIYLGEISFAFYLIHQLVIRYYSALAGYFKYEFNVILVGIFLFLFSIISSIFAFEIIEKPFNSKIKKKLYDKIS